MGRTPSRRAAILNELPKLELSRPRQRCEPTTVKQLRELASCFAPSVLCVQETQVHKTRVENLKNTLGFDHAFAVSSIGRSGGLGIIWNNNMRVKLLSYLQYHIDVILI